MANPIWRIKIVKSNLISMKIGTRGFWRLLISNLKSTFQNFKIQYGGTYMADPIWRTKFLKRIPISMRNGEKRIVTVLILNVK